jgi:hypothetical protein
MKHQIKKRHLSLTHFWIREPVFTPPHLGNGCIPAAASGKPVSYRSSYHNKWEYTIGHRSLDEEKNIIYSSYLSKEVYYLASRKANVIKKAQKRIKICQ